MPPKRKRLSRTQREKKKLEWETFARKQLAARRRFPRIDWRETPDADSEGIALAPTHADQAIKLLKDAGLEFWTLGPLENVCWVREHDEP